MKSVSVEFTRDELDALVALLDMAVKASGLQGARPALAIIAKLEAAAKPAETEEGHA